MRINEKSTFYVERVFNHRPIRIPLQRSLGLATDLRLNYKIIPYNWILFKWSINRVERFTQVLRAFIWLFITSSKKIHCMKSQSRLHVKIIIFYYSCFFQRFHDWTHFDAIWSLSDKFLTENVARWQDYKWCMTKITM